MAAWLHSLIFGSLRRQLIFGIAFIHALMMTIFVTDLTLRQRDLLIKYQSEHAASLARSLAASSAAWLASRDYRGLAEIIASQSAYPEMQFAMVLDRNGRVLAHTDPRLLNQHVLDLPPASDGQVHILNRSSDLIDALAPVILSDRQIGWVRIGLGQELLRERMGLIGRTGVAYAVMAIFVGIVLAVLISLWMTRRLRLIQQVAAAVQDGDLSVRAQTAGEDESAQLAHGFNAMLDALADRENALRNSEELYRELNMHLEDLVNVRTAQLAHAKEAAEAANRAKSAFLATMSHELRTPLHAILGFTQIMQRDTALSPEQRHRLEIIHRSGQHLLTLINDVLEISRIEAGRANIKKDAFDLTALLQSVTEMILPRATAHELTLTIEQGDDVPRAVLGDARHLRQVLINLLVNAVKYTERGGVKLSVKRVGDEAIRFAVSDTGPGIADADKERIFEAFCQTDSAAARGEGVGLGLTISFELVRLMGGRLILEDSSPQGSTFAFTLTLPAADLSPPLPPSGPVIGLESGQTPPRVLVVDDNDDNRELIVHLMETAGFPVRSARSGQQAIEIFGQWHPQLVWMDMRMPGMDGYAATRAIRALPGGAESHIVALTASVFPEDRSAVLAAGCEDMLAKPIKEDDLFALIERLLGLRLRRAEVREEQTSLDSMTSDAVLTGLTLEQRNRLAQAAATLDVEICRSIANELSEAHPAQGQRLQQLIAGYRFDLIAKLSRAMPSNG